MTTVVLGLDGGCFDLIDEWVDDGTLPTIATLREGGVAVDMESCPPPVTCPNWRCYSTGRNPGKLGVFWFEKVDRENERIVNTITSDEFDGTDFWHQLDERAAIVNLPTSYPPPDVNGIHISGGPGAEQTGYTNPASLEDELEIKYKYQVQPEKMGLLSKDDVDNECIDEIYTLINRRFDLVEDLIESGDYGFVHLTIFYINVLQHFYNDDPVVRRAWELVDERLGELLSGNEVDHLFVMSDHGTNKIDVEFNINTWLEREGYLVTRSNSSDFLGQLGMTRERVRPLLAKLKLEWIARRLVPRRVQYLLPDDDGQVKMSGKERVIDWNASSAVASGQGPVYVLADDPTEREVVRDELIEKLDGLRDDSGRTVLGSAQPAEAIYEGPYVSDGPDLFLRRAPGTHINGNIGSDEVFEGQRRWQGTNKDTGMFIAYGPTIDPDAKLDEMRITDIAPSILHLMDKPAFKQMDGTVRTEIFMDQSDPGSREPRRTTEETPRQGKTRANEEDADMDSTQELLEDLGYLE
jgi:predicted AlkP superfamily phosphohydrolase/phosphomutase